MPNIELIPAADPTTTFNGLPLKDVIQFLCGAISKKEFRLRNPRMIDGYFEETIRLASEVFEVTPVEKIDA